MGQIVGGAAKPKRCNLNKLSQLGTPAAGEYILVSSDNSMNAAGQGDFDAYVKGDGVTPATELKLKSVDNDTFDISAYHATGDVLAKYVDLSSALDGGSNIPEAFRKGGMSVKFVRSSDNMYVQYRLMSDTFNTTLANWQGVDDEPTVGSENLVKSGGVASLVLIDFSNNGYIRDTDGVYVAAFSWRCTNYIKVVKDDVIDIHISSSSGAKSIACYDNDKTYLPNAFSYNDGQNQDIKFICPEGVSFVRICDSKNNNYFAKYHGNILTSLSEEAEEIVNTTNTVSKLTGEANVLKSKESVSEVLIKKTILIDSHSNLEDGYVTDQGIVLDSFKHFKHVALDIDERCFALNYSGATLTPAKSYIIFESNGVKTNPNIKTTSSNIIIPKGTTKVYFNFFGDGFADSFSIDTIISQEEVFDKSFLIHDEYNNTGYIDNQGIYHDSGSSNKYRTSDYIDVSCVRNIKVVCIKDVNIVAAYCFYDENKNPILPAEMSNDTSERNVIVPNTARYVRSTVTNNINGDNLSRICVPTMKDASLVGMKIDNEVEYRKEYLILEDGYVTITGIKPSNQHKYYCIELAGKNAEYVYFDAAQVPGVSYIIAKKDNSYTRLDYPMVASGKFIIPDCDCLYLNFFEGEGLADCFVIKYGKLDVKLFDSINKPILFNGKTLVAFGDSITFGVSSPGLVNAGSNKYISLFCSHVGATEVNQAVSGSCIATGRNEYTSIYEKITMFDGTADIIWIAGGINDWQTQSPIGSFSDTVTTTVYGALNGICSYLKTNYPNVVVIFVTPIPTTSTTTFGTQHPDNLNLYRKVIQEVAAANGFNVVDGADLGLPDKMTSYGNVMYAPDDCVHPTLAGHALYARSLAGKLL